MEQVADSAVPEYWALGHDKESLKSDGLRRGRDMTGLSLTLTEACLVYRSSLERRLM